MLRLALVRHAKSARDDPGLADFDRPLARRGRAAAAWIGETLRERDWVPEQVICSPAARTRETLALSGIEALDVSFEDDAYRLRDEDYVGLIRKLGRRRSLMLVGHNMAISTTGAALAGGELGTFATGAIAVLDFEAEAWGEVRARTGRLVDYLRPPKE